MVPKILTPLRELLSEEYVLIQAWKKTAAHLRRISWVTDTLAIDRAMVNQPKFIAGLRDRLRAPGPWKTDPLRLIPAPKGQDWHINSETSRWEPKPSDEPTGVRFRPLAHVSLADQVVSTAILLCLANRVETRQGDPRVSITKADSRKKVVSYGNRLFCDEDLQVSDEELFGSLPGVTQGGRATSLLVKLSDEGELFGLCHRWGSAKLYRAYFQDYQNFHKRPQVTASEFENEGQQIFAVHTDLKQFYDRVRPSLLKKALEEIQKPEDDPEFFAFAKSALNWVWDPRDKDQVQSYANQAGIEDFSSVALPQNLVASGFFANMVMHPIDAKMKASIGKKLDGGVRILDACRYVDDFRITVSVDQSRGEEEVKEVVHTWLDQVIKEKASALELSEEKTKCIPLNDEERPFLRQSARMERIQAQVSGGVDALGGRDILDALQALVDGHEAASKRIHKRSKLPLPIPDVKEGTVARFAAARYRRTFRSIRPLLDPDTEPSLDPDYKLVPGSRTKVPTQAELDTDARLYATDLVARWMNDPSHVKLLRIGLDICPDEKILYAVLRLLHMHTKGKGEWTDEKQVAWYCMAEVLRAGATETGLVPEDECLPAGVELSAYREVLAKEAVRIMARPSASTPWYARQQALLFLATFDENLVSTGRAGRTEETKHYWRLIRFLSGKAGKWSDEEFATLAVLARHSYTNPDNALQLADKHLNKSRRRKLASLDPSFVVELIEDKELSSRRSARVQKVLWGKSGKPKGKLKSLADLVLYSSNEPLRNELSLLRFAMAFLKAWRKLETKPSVITPVQVVMKLRDRHGAASIKHLEIQPARDGVDGLMYEVPSWCEASERWRLQLGYLLRFVLSGQPDFTKIVSRRNGRGRSTHYRRAPSHWYQRLHGLHNGRTSFGGDWIPITDFMEELLMGLLQWPGCRPSEWLSSIEGGLDATVEILSSACQFREKHFWWEGEPPFLPVKARQLNPSCSKGKLHVCVAQTMLPAPGDFNAEDLELNGAQIRKRHRSHLASTLAVIRQMLVWRGTNKREEGHLDWLILPELAVHPRDVNTLLIPFARSQKCMILAGLTYETLQPGKPAVNAAIWIVPEHSKEHGLQIKTFRQGKAHLSRREWKFNNGEDRLMKFRPCQWLLIRPAPEGRRKKPLVLSASVGYDATDLILGADLRHYSKIHAVCALNDGSPDSTSIAEVLKHTLEQPVIVAHNGQSAKNSAHLGIEEILGLESSSTRDQVKTSAVFFSDYMV